ncbi:hypothetical protein ATY79_19135 [Rhizobium sp. R693]|nr:hypothetical protein ATY79_19135 [Rhizobium sp. R693]
MMSSISPAWPQQECRHCFADLGGSEDGVRSIIEIAFELHEAVHALRRVFPVPSTESRRLGAQMCQIINVDVLDVTSSGTVCKESS